MIALVEFHGESFFPEPLFSGGNEAFQTDLMLAAPIVENGKLPVRHGRYPYPEPHRIFSRSPDLILVGCQFGEIDVAAFCLEIIMLRSVFGGVFFDLHQSLGSGPGFPGKNILLKENAERFRAGDHQVFRSRLRRQFLMEPHRAFVDIAAVQDIRFEQIGPFRCRHHR